jgi:hypothetical protein
MQPLVDPRHGDIEDDASSTKSNSLLAMAGSLLGEISFAKLIVAWLILFIVPAVIVGLVVIAWLLLAGLPFGREKTVVATETSETIAEGTVDRQPAEIGTVVDLGGTMEAPFPTQTESQTLPTQTAPPITTTQPPPVIVEEPVVIPPPPRPVPVRTGNARTKPTSVARRTGASGNRSRVALARRKPIPMPRKLASRTKLVMWTR